MKQTSAKKKLPPKKVVRRTQEERSATTRSQLISAAGECIAALGLNKSTGAVIAEKAGLTSGAVQHHFRSRDELLWAVVDVFGKSLGDLSGDEFRQSEELPVRVDRLFERYSSHFNTPLFLAVMKIWLGTEKTSPLYAEIIDRMRWFEIQFDREWIDLFSDCAASPDTIATARHIALSAMRGQVIGLSYSIDRDRSQKESRLLKQMLIHTLQGHGASSEKTGMGTGKNAGPATRLQPKKKTSRIANISNGV